MGSPADAPEPSGAFLGEDSGVERPFRKPLSSSPDRLQAVTDEIDRALKEADLVIYAVRFALYKVERDYWVEQLTGHTTDDSEDTVSSNS